MSNYARASRVVRRRYCYGNRSELKRLTMNELSTKLTLFVTSPSLMLPSSIQELILFALCAILSCHMAKRVLFSAKTVTGYLAEVRKVFHVMAVSYTVVRRRW